MVGVEIAPTDDDRRDDGDDDRDDGASDVNEADGDRSGDGQKDALERGGRSVGDSEGIGDGSGGGDDLTSAGDALDARGRANGIDSGRLRGRFNTGAVEDDDDNDDDDEALPAEYSGEFCMRKEAEPVTVGFGRGCCGRDLFCAGNSGDGVGIDDGDDEDENRDGEGRGKKGRGAVGEKDWVIILLPMSSAFIFIPIFILTLIPVLPFKFKFRFRGMFKFIFMGGVGEMFMCRPEFKGLPIGGRGGRGATAIGKLWCCTGDRRASSPVMHMALSISPYSHTTVPSFN